MSCTPSFSAPVLFDCENLHLRSLLAQTHHGISADLVASIEGFSREDLDSFAWNSQQRAAASIAAGAFAGSVVPVYKDDGTLALDAEEYPRPATTLERLASLTQIGRASVRERVWQSGEYSGGAVAVKK